MIKRLLVIFLVLLGLGASSFFYIARAYTDAEVQKATGKAVRQIYDQLVASKGTIRALSGLSEITPKVDELGWPYLEYSQALPDTKRFYLLVRALPSQGIDYHRRLDGYREFVSTVMDVKLMVYVNNLEALGNLNIYEVVKTATSSIYPEGKGNSQLQLRISTDKKVFRRSEKIGFDIELRNEGTVALKLRKMDEGSISCFFNGLLWGVGEPDSPKEAILPPGGVFHKRFAFRAEKKGPLEIRCAYGLRFMGDQPTATAMVDVQ